VTIIGCTGHQALSPSTVIAVRLAITEILASHASETLTGLTNLAVGSDQIFARAVLAVGGRLHVVIPSANYATTFSSPDEQDAFSYLLGVAGESTQLPYPDSTEEAFMAGGRAVVDGCDLLLAVWDGKPAAGLGGTADVVTYARQQGTLVQVIWPKGASRT
jgi:hypothetical protein